jgi:hypothetical protein
MHNLFVEEGSPKIWANCGFFKKKLPEVSNHPMDEFLPNLVTLRLSQLLRRN